jgi:FKBP-type peptidyl-prolyl cis-trans isomerase
MNRKLIATAVAFAAMLLTGCNNVPVVDIQPSKGDTLKENIINANRYLAQGEETQIDAYAERRKWQMRRLPSGVRVMETSSAAPKAEQIDYEDRVALSYRLEAINGNVIYSHIDDTVTVGHLEPTRGLDAAMRTLHNGSSAKVIVPSAEGYGVVGDGNAVGSRMILVYDLKVKKI